MSSIERFRTLLRIPTISRIDGTTDWTEFERFVSTLAECYPLSHSRLEREVIDGHSLLYGWRGGEAGDPSVLMAHYDVVPATAEGWRFPPFEARVTGVGEERTIWARGALDDKGALVSLFEAVESKLAAGFVPARDVYLSIGHDEETLGTGALSIARLLAGRGIRAALVLDEGGAIVEGVFPGVAAPVAVVGVSEKGITTLRLRVEQHGGHASTPPAWSATARLARAIVRLNGLRFPATLSSVAIDMLHTVGAHATQPFRALFLGARWTRPILIALFARLSDETAALIRTTHVVTELSGSAAANVMAASASASVNVRIAIGSSVTETLARVVRAIHDPAVAVEAIHASEPSPVSPAAGLAWEAVRASIQAVYPGTVVTPYVMLAASDSRHFALISNHVYRFSPFRMSTEERASLHAADERIGAATFLRGIEFYERLIERL